MQNASYVVAELTSMPARPAETKDPDSRDLGPLPMPPQRASVGCGTRSIRVPPGSPGLPAAHFRGREMARYPTDHAGLEILPFDRCLQLLTTVPVGRISFFADGEIVVLPVNHVVDGQDPIFCTARGSKLSAAEGQNLVAFEADDYDERTKSGWSVLVNGRAQAVYEDAEIQRLSHLGLHPWVTGVERPFWIRIRPTSISGRRTSAPG